MPEKIEFHKRRVLSAEVFHTTDEEISEDNIGQVFLRLEYEDGWTTWYQATLEGWAQPPLAQRVYELTYQQTDFTEH